MPMVFTAIRSRLPALALLWAMSGSPALAAPAAPAPVVEDARRETLPVTIHAGESTERTLPATLILPRRKAGERVPLALVFGGFENAGRVLDLIRTEMPVALASFDYPFQPPRKFEFPESLKHGPELKRMVPDTLAGIRALTAQLGARPEIDSAKILIIGASFGAPFAVLAAAEDPALRAVVLVHGFGRTAATLNHVILKNWLPRMGWPAYPAAWLLSRAGLAYLGITEPEERARELRAHQKLLMISAEEDSFIPRESSDSLWRAVERSAAASERIWMPGDHLQPGSDRLIGQILGRVRDWMDRSELL